MVQGSKGYIAQICEVHLQFGNSTKNGRLTLFLVNSTLIYILFSLETTFIVKESANYTAQRV